jgi:hypothetical protein
MHRLLLATIPPILAAALCAQPLRLERRPGTNPGSYPGNLGLQIRGINDGFAAIFLSLTPGPIPLRIIDQNDNRQLDVGPPFATLSGFITGGVYTGPNLGVRDDPTFLDAVIYAQGFTIPGSGPTLIGEISNPAPMRFAPANTFRDRRTQFTTPRAFFPVIEIADQRWMMLGGGAGGLLAQVATRKTEIYDPLTDTFSDGPDLTVPRSLHTATKLADGRHLIVAGVDGLNDPQNSAEIYDPSTHAFTAVPSMTNVRMGHTATRLSNGKVLVTGGLSDLNGTGVDPINSALDTTEIYDPQTNTWSAGPRMRKPRAGHGALTLPDNRVLLIGGVSWTLVIIVKIPTILSDCDIYNPATNQITAGPSMVTARAVFPIADLGGNRHLVSGGLNSVSLANPGAPTNRAEVFNANTMQWTLANPMAQARGMHTALALGGGRHLVIGGADGTLSAPVPLQSCEIFDDTTGQWSAGPSMTQSRAAFGFFESPLGHGHLLGGASGASAAVDNTTDWYYR